METTRLPLITIPEPCHEDWNNMTPDKRGAFCSMCSKSVWDFTNKTPDEIQTILMQETGKKVCGRFRHEQLAQPVNVDIPFYLLKGVRLPRLTRFAVAAFVIFGSALFSFTSANAQLGMIRLIPEPQEMVGEIQVADIPPPADSTMVPTPVSPDTIVPPTLIDDVLQMVQVGQVSFKLPLVVDSTDSTPKVNALPFNCTGFSANTKPAPPANDGNNAGDNKGLFTNKDGKVIEPNYSSFSQVSELPIVGRISVKHYNNDDTLVPLPPGPQPLVIVPIGQNVQTHDALKTSSPSETNGFTGDDLFSISPNPTVNLLNISYSIGAKADITFEIYDLNGKMLKQLTAGEQHESGAYHRSFDISMLSPGAYLCTMKAERLTQTVKFIKTE